MVREDIQNFGLGSPSIYVEYHRRLAVALADSLVDPSCRHKSVTSCLLSHQINHLKMLCNDSIQAGTGTSLHIKRQIQSHLRARQLLCIHESKLHLVMEGSSLHLNDLKFISETTAARTPPPPNLNTLIACIIKPLRTLGISGFHDLTATNEQFLLSGNQLKQKYSKVYKKHIIAINRLAELINLPSTEDLTAERISSILSRKEPLFHTLPCTRKINNPAFSEIWDSNFLVVPAQNTSTNHNTQSHPPTAFHPVPAPQPRSNSHVTHPITRNRVSRVNPPASHDPFDPSTPTARNQDTPPPTQVAATYSLHTANSGPQAANLLRMDWSAHRV